MKFVLLHAIKLIVMKSFVNKQKNSQLKKNSIKIPFFAIYIFLDVIYWINIKSCYNYIIKRIKIHHTTSILIMPQTSTWLFKVFKCFLKKIRGGTP